MRLLDVAAREPGRIGDEAVDADRRSPRPGTVNSRTPAVRPVPVIRVRPAASARRSGRSADQDEQEDRPV